jgi:hypothetical protein
MARKQNDSSKIGSISLQGSTAEYLVPERVQTLLRCAYRRQPDHDWGIDGQIEILDEEGSPSGRLIAAQVKTDYDLDAQGLPYMRGEWKHFNYWETYNLPVIVFLVTADKTVYWKQPTPANIKHTGHSWTLTFSEVLNSSDRDRFAKLAPPASSSDYRQRLHRLALDRRLILEANGQPLNGAVRFQEEHVEDSCVGDQVTFKERVTISLDTSAPHDVLSEFDFSVREDDLLPKLRAMFPWAEVGFDDDATEDVDRAEYEETQMIFEEGEEPYPATFGSFEEWRADKGSRPRLVRDWEHTWLFPFELRANSLGKAFVRVDEYLSSSSLDADAAEDPCRERPDSTGPDQDSPRRPAASPSRQSKATCPSSTNSPTV